MLKFIENSELLSRLSADADGSFVASKLEEIERDSNRLQRSMTDFADIPEDRAEIENLLALNRAATTILEALSALLRQSAAMKQA